MNDRDRDQALVSALKGDVLPILIDLNDNISNLCVVAKHAMDQRLREQEQRDLLIELRANQQNMSSTLNAFIGTQNSHGAQLQSLEARVIKLTAIGSFVTFIASLMASGLVRYATTPGLTH